MLELYTSEPNGFFLKPLIALHEKGASFKTHYFDAADIEAPRAWPDTVEARLHLEREGPVLVHDGTVIVSSFFMLEYIAEALPGPSLLPESPIDRYRARASGQFLGAWLGSLVPVLGCAKYLAPRLAARDAKAIGSAIAALEPVERRNAWQSVVDGTYTPAIQATARERLKFPVNRVESALATGPWLAGPNYSVADIDAFAMLRSVPDLAPEVVNDTTTPRVVEYLARIGERAAVHAALASSRGARPEQYFVPGVEPSRWG